MPTSPLPVPNIPFQINYLVDSLLFLDLDSIPMPSDPATPAIRPERLLVALRHFAESVLLSKNEGELDKACRTPESDILASPPCPYLCSSSLTVLTT